jgi:hypothetical protein
VFEEFILLENIKKQENYFLRIKKYTTRNNYTQRFITQAKEKNTPHTDNNIRRDNNTT